MKIYQLIDKYIDGNFNDIVLINWLMKNINKN